MFHINLKVDENLQPLNLKMFIKLNSEFRPALIFSLLQFCDRQPLRWSCFSDACESSPLVCGLILVIHFIHFQGAQQVMGCYFRDWVSKRSVFCLVLPSLTLSDGRVDCEMLYGKCTCQGMDVAGWHPGGSKFHQQFCL